MKWVKKSSKFENMYPQAGNNCINLIILVKIYQLPRESVFFRILFSFCVPRQAVNC
ncbi:hypothetical protein J2S25_001055 [Mesobacillus stamsii]|uniref:Uncharacterized protein n=1 Tax=Mesobacillus stamsii TaxID=225347 RepID=A0ABU0FSS4_9BACI|nr:hypothetical protein [Mesobacillus stamsii]